MTTVRPTTADELGEVLTDLDLRDLVARPQVADPDAAGGDVELELIIGDGDNAVAITTSWTKDLERAAERAEHVGNELHHLAAVLRERAERKRRPIPLTRHPEMGILPTQ